MPPGREAGPSCNGERDRVGSSWYHRAMSYVETEEQQMLRRQVSEIGRKYGREYYVAKAREGLSPTELWDEVANQGFIGVNTPEEYGGGGLGIYELAIVCEELAASGCPLLLLLVSPAICVTVIARFGTDAQKERWLPRLASGEMKMAFAITEPWVASTDPTQIESGSDLVGKDSFETSHPWDAGKPVGQVPPHASAHVQGRTGPALPAVPAKTSVRWTSSISM